ncbi:hypothetical protein HMPREF3189_01564 [Clostridiales bacterium KA00134]|nr:hypothetical protein HMPREF3189_01564 [Clostridiales bacterium KA00134]
MRSLVFTCHTAPDILKGAKMIIGDIFEKDKLTAVDLKNSKYEVLNVINKDKDKIILAKGDKSYLVIDGRFKNMFFPSLEEAEEYIESKK